MSQEKQNVSITSRAAESHASWMLSHLRSNTYRGLIGTVTYLPITNRNKKEWMESVKASSSAILYHTTKHGRLNVTDVTDSLYDTELQYLSESLGRQNVMVVLDDLQNSDDEVKNRILQSQPSISKWASQLLLFTHKDKDPVPEAQQKVLLAMFSTEAMEEKPVTSRKWLYPAAGLVSIMVVFLFSRRFRKKGFF